MSSKRTKADDSDYILRSQVGRARIERLAHVIKLHLPDGSDAFAYLRAQALALAQEEVPHAYHLGKDDLDALDDFQAGFSHLRAALNSLSPWARTALETGFRQEAPVTDKLEELAQLMELGRKAIRRAKKMIHTGPVRGQRYWLEVMLVDIAAMLWESDSTKTLPKNLNPATPFARFLEDIFECFEFEHGKQPSPVSMYNSWKVWRRKFKSG